MDNTTTKARKISRPVCSYLVPILQDATRDHMLVLGKAIMNINCIKEEIKSELISGKTGYNSVQDLLSSLLCQP
jgi:hypothetical protein